jgi:hypothetical protein
MNGAHGVKVQLKSGAARITEAVGLFAPQNRVFQKITVPSTGAKEE